MTRAITSPELALLRSEGQWSQLYMAVLKPNTVYTARLASVPVSNDQVFEISYNSGSGTLADVKAGMTLLVGTTAGARDLGLCRIRTAPDGSKIYIGETSEIIWSSNCYLTITDDFDLWARHIHVDDTEYLFMDYNIVYTDQHANFDPVPVLGTHACLWLTGVDVSVGFDASDSWVFDSTISSYAWSAPGSSTISGDTTATPTITYNAAGVYRVMCTVTAATGKTAMGVRYVFVYDDDNPPATVFQLANCEGNVDAGGWMFDVTMQAEATLIDLREGTLVVLFARDYYEGTEQSIGPIAGRENIICVGRVGPSESIRWDPISGQVHFIVYGPHFWMGKMKISATQLEFTSGSPANWNQVKNLTVDRALWHLMHWRSTATIVMDFYPTLDTLYDNKIASLANYLWTQLGEFAGLKLMAHVLCDRFGRLYACVDPQMVQASARSSFPVVMTVTEEDWSEVVEFERTTVFETGQVNISTRTVNSSGVSYTLYSLSPGHMPRRHGEWEINDGMLAASQTDSNHKAGLLLGWKNNEFSDIPLRLAQNNRMMDITPQQFLSITISAGDTPRGVAYSGHIIPRRITLRYDAEARFLSTDPGCEGETFEQITANGDIPGSGNVDPSIPPLPPLPPLPDLPPVIPGGIPEPTRDAPTKVLLLDENVGLIYTENFDEASPSWFTVNAGLSTPLLGTTPPYQLIQRFFVCPNGAVYVYRMQSGTPSLDTDVYFLARAPSIGATFEMLVDITTVNVNGIYCAGYNPLVPETVMYLRKDSTSGTNIRAYIGSGSTFSAGLNGLPTTGGGSGTGGGLSYGYGIWLYQQGSGYRQISQNGSSLVASASLASLSFELFNPETEPIFRASTMARVMTKASSDRLLISTDNLVTQSYMAGVSDLVGFDCDPTGMLLMSRYNSGTGRYKSSDAGATWISMGALPVGNYYYKWAGRSGVSASRWIAAGAVVRFSDDFGTTWQNKEGNITSIAPVPSIKGIWVVEY
jgi:hypothetical protein